MLRSLVVQNGDETEKYVCAHWRVFPPPGAGQDIEALRASNTVTDEQYNRLRLWAKICGLFDMKESKCMTCPHRRKIVWKTRGPCLVSPDGVEVAVVDATTGESNPRTKESHLTTIFRRPGTKGSHKPAAWTQREDNEDGDG